MNKQTFINTDTESWMVRYGALPIKVEDYRKVCA